MRPFRPVLSPPASLITQFTCFTSKPAIYIYVCICAHFAQSCHQLFLSFSVKLLLHASYTPLTRLSHAYAPISSAYVSIRQHTSAYVRVTQTSSLPAIAQLSESGLLSLYSASIPPLLRLY